MTICRSLKLRQDISAQFAAHVHSFAMLQQCTLCNVVTFRNPANRLQITHLLVLQTDYTLMFFTQNFPVEATQLWHSTFFGNALPRKPINEPSIAAIVRSQTQEFAFPLNKTEFPKYPNLWELFVPHTRKNAPPQTELIPGPGVETATSRAFRFRGDFFFVFFWGRGIMMVRFSIGRDW